MYVAIIAGGIASGKSSFARELERLGAVRIDLDEVSRAVLDGDAELVAAVSEAFGADVVDSATGSVRRRLLAERAFATREAAALLEALELPAIERELRARLSALRRSEAAGGCVVVEVPLLDRLADPHAYADEVVAVTCPPEVRLRRAVARGMDEADARARMANQPADAWLAGHADTLVENMGSPDDLLGHARAWWAERERAGWRRRMRGGTDGS